MSGNRGIETVENSVFIDGNSINTSISREGAVEVKGKPISVTVELEIELSKEDKAALFTYENKDGVNAKQRVKIKVTPTGDGNQICLDVFSDKGKLPGRFIKLVKNNKRGIILEVCDSDGNQILDNNQKMELVVLENDEIAAAS